LLPPAVASGLLLADGHAKPACGALLLAAANVTAINLAAMVTFWWKGLRPRHWWAENKARKSFRRGLAIFIVLFAGLTAVVVASRTYFES